MIRGSRHILSILLVTGVSLSGLMLSGCDLMAEINKYNPFAEKPAEGEAAAEGEAGHDAAAPEEHASVEDEETLAENPEMVDFPYEEIEFQASDGAIIKGRLYDPYQASESEDDPETTYPLVILLHGLNRDQTEWGTLPKTLVDNGLAVLSLDLRGHGTSNRDKYGRVLTWRRFEESDFKLMATDIGRALKVFRVIPDEEPDYPQIDASHTAIIGSKLGANVTLLAADKYPDRIKAIALLSPAIEYKKLNVTNAIIRYPNAIFIAASQIEPTSFEASQKLYKWALGPKSIQLYKKVGDGSDMLRNEPALQKRLIAWLKHYLGLAPGALAPQAADEAAESAEPAEKETAH